MKKQRKICCGASNTRDIKADGRDAKGIMFAVDFLKEVTKKLIDCGYDSKAVMTADDFSFKNVKGKDVIVIGDGDVVKNIHFMGGCDGNLKAIPLILEGWTVDQIEEKL